MNGAIDINRKFTKPLVYLSIIATAILIGFISAYIDYKIVFVIIAVFFSLFIAVVSILYPYFGFYSCIVLSALIFTPERMFGIFLPFGIGIEIYTYFTLLGVLTNNYAKQEINREFWRHPITIGIIVLFIFYTMEVANPSMHSFLGWFNYYRKYISFFAFYFVSYCLLNSKESIRFFIKFWLFFTPILALYAIKQQWFGLFNWELTWIMADDTRYLLLYQHGLLRKFSILPDPAASGVLFAGMVVFTLIMAIRTSNKKMKWWLYLFAIINFLGFSYSGTRTGNLMILAGILFYCVATIFEKRSLRFLTASIIAVVFIMIVPINNPVLFRIRSTFSGSKDPSAAFRDMNRKNIQPYIYRHPIGGGIYTCGLEGQIYNPGHVLASVPPDSGYMKIAMEQGWIGLALTLLIYYIILRTGIKNFYRAREPELRTTFLMSLTMIFTLMVGQFSQIVIGQYPTIYFYYPAIVILIKLVRYDQNNKMYETELF